jgi:DNA repair protein RadC
MRTGNRNQLLICVSINGANEVINVRVITIGLINRTHVHPREVFADVIAEHASAVIIAHNHPVGDLIPSKEDSEITIKTKAAGEVLGINILDHIIFNRENYFGFMENNAL